MLFRSLHTQKLFAEREEHSVEAVNYTSFWIDVWDRGLVVPDPFLLCFEKRLHREWATEKEVLIESRRRTGDEGMDRVLESGWKGGPRFTKG